MAKSLANAISRCQVHALACSGMKAAPDDPPDNLSVFPFSVAYPERGQIFGESGNLIRGIHVIIVEIHVARTILKEAVKLAKGYVEEFSAKIVADPTLNGAVDNVLFEAEQQVTYEFGRLEWANTPTIGVRFHIPVKIRNATS